MITIEIFNRSLRFAYYSCSHLKDHHIHKSTNTQDAKHIKPLGLKYDDLRVDYVLVFLYVCSV